MHYSIGVNNGVAGKYCPSPATPSLPVSFACRVLPSIVRYTSQHSRLRELVSRTDNLLFVLRDPRKPVSVVLALRESLPPHFRSRVPFMPQNSNRKYMDCSLTLPQVAAAFRPNIFGEHLCQAMALLIVVHTVEVWYDAS